MSLSTYPASEAEYDARIEAQAETPEERSDRICDECWRGKPNGNYSLKEVVENSAEELAEFVIQASKHDMNLNAALRAELKKYADRIAGVKA